MIHQLVLTLPDLTLNISLQMFQLFQVPFNIAGI